MCLDDSGLSLRPFMLLHAFYDQHIWKYEKFAEVLYVQISSETSWINSKLQLVSRNKQNSKNDCFRTGFPKRLIHTIGEMRTRLL